MAIVGSETKCPICKKLFIAETIRDVYCSNECRTYIRKKRARIRSAEYRKKNKELQKKYEEEKK